MRPTPKLTDSLRLEASNWRTELGLSETWTLELLPPPVEGGKDIECAVEPDAPGGKTMGELEGPGCMANAVAGEVAGINSSIGEGVPLDPWSPAKPIAREVKPLLPTTGVARTAREV